MASNASHVKLPVEHSEDPSSANCMFEKPSPPLNLIVAGVFAGLDGVHGLAGWQWLFILEGTLGYHLCAVIALFVLLDYSDSKTASTRWSMTEDLRRLAAARMEADRVSGPQNTRSVGEACA